MKKLFIPFLLLAAYVTSCKTTGEAVNLKLQMPVGNVYEYTFIMDMNMDQSVMGQQMKMNNKMTMGYTFEVLKDSASWKTMKSTMGRMRMDMKMNGQEMSIDTQEKPADTTSPQYIMYSAFSAMQGKHFMFTINDKGEVGQVTGLREMQNAVLQELPQGEEVEKQLAGTFDEQSFRQNLQQSFNIFPDKEVVVGESWKKTMDIKSQGMNVKNESTYTLESVKDGKAFIKVKSVLTSDKATVQNGMEMSMKGDGDGTFTYEQSTGMVMDGEIKMKMNMEMTMQGQKMPMEMDMNMKINGKKR